MVAFADLCAARLPSIAGRLGDDVQYAAKNGAVSIQGKGILVQPGSLVLGGDMLGNDLTLRYPAASFPAVKGDFFTVAGKQYRVREYPRASDDGTEKLALLEDV